MQAAYAWPPQPVPQALRNSKPVVWDPIRHRWVAATPEEQVRQSLVCHLVQDKHYPLQLLATERGLRIGGQRKRFDLIAFSPQGAVLLLVECKAPGVALGAVARLQLAGYQAHYQAACLVLTNGPQLEVWLLQPPNPTQLTALPHYAALCQLINK